MKYKHSLYRYILLTLFFSTTISFYGIAQDKTFTLVIDAGHGGKDPGARGRHINEKQINLSVALKLGKLISNNHSDVNIVYTRKSDVFIELDERANIANRNKADLFISIHTNAVKKGNTVSGTETYTLGLARTDENLEVAMRENSAILLEDNYLQKYEGFDPNSSESYIIFEFMQNKHMEQSVSLASAIQKSFVNANRLNRGVRQAGFLVLRKTSMPSVLIELGYISNANEEAFMKSDAGQTKLASAIYNAFSKFKWECDRKRGSLSSNRSSAPVPLEMNDTVIEEDIIKEEPQNTASQTDENIDITAPIGSEEYIRQKRKAEERSKTRISTSQTSTKQAASQSVLEGKIIYKIQILSSDRKLSPNSKRFKGYKNIDFFIEKDVYKYTYGESTSFNSIKQKRREIIKDFKDAFIIAFKDGKRIKY